MKYTFGNKGIRTIIFTAMFINFFAVIGMTLLTPLFKSTPEFGVVKYGYVMGCMMLGAVVGMLIFSVFKIKPDQRADLFGASVMCPCARGIPEKRGVDVPACDYLGNHQCYR